MKQLTKATTILAFILFISGMVWAGSVTTLNTFVANTPAVADDVNANFTNVKNAVDDNDSRIATNTNSISVNTGNITTNADAIVNLRASATATVDDIQTNTGNVTNNTTAINTLQTSVTATVDDIQTNTSNITTNADAIDNLRASATATVDDIQTNTSNIATNADAIDNLRASATAITNFVNQVSIGGSNTAAVTVSSADNPIISVDCSSGESLQAAIETSPLHGKVVIEITGTCIDDIYLRRDGITIQGSGGSGNKNTNIIQGNATGFSSAENENYQYTSINPVGLVQRQPNTGGNGMSGAFETRDRRFTLKDLTINAGLNFHAMRIGNNSRVRLINVDLNGHNYGMRLFNNSVAILSDITINTDGTVGIDGSGNGTCNNPFCGSGIFASVNSSVVLKSGNTLNAAANANDDYGLAAINGVAISLRGADNIINSLSIVKSTFEQTRFEQDGTGNQITGDLEVCFNSSFIAQQVAIDTSFSEIEVCASSNMLLIPRSENAISVATEDIDIEENSLLIVSDEANQLSPYAVEFSHPSGGNININIELQSSFVNENGGTMPANFEIFGNSNLSLYNGTIVNGDIEMYQNSSFFSEADSDINGDLAIFSFSTYEAAEQGSSVAPGSVNQSVSGTVNCGNAEAFEYSNSGVINDLCDSNN